VGEWIEVHGEGAEGTEVGGRGTCQDAYFLLVVGCQEVLVTLLKQTELTT
jgi:hypothetical protein